METKSLAQIQIEMLEGAQYAHVLTEIVGWLMADMQASHILRGKTKNNIFLALKTLHEAAERSHAAIERMKTIAQSETPLDREDKRRRPD